MFTTIFCNISIKACLNRIVSMCGDSNTYSKLECGYIVVNVFSSVLVNSTVDGHDVQIQHEGITTFCNKSVNSPPQNLTKQMINETGTLRGSSFSVLF